MNIFDNTIYCYLNVIQSKRKREYSKSMYEKRKGPRKERKHGKGEGKEKERKEKERKEKEREKINTRQNKSYWSYNQYNQFVHIFRWDNVGRFEYA